MKRAQRLFPALICTLLLCSPHLLAGDRRRAAAVSPVSASLSITFLDGLVDAGTLAWKGERTKSSIARRIVPMRVGQQSSEARGSVTLRAFLATTDNRSTIRVNGITLSSIPQIVERHAPVGIAFTQRLEIEVSTNEPPGALDAAIVWEVVTE